MLIMRIDMTTPSVSIFTRDEINSNIKLFLFSSLLSLHCILFLSFLLSVPILGVRINNSNSS